jgi:hypothetical protein
MYPPTPASPDMSRAQGVRSALHVPVVQLHQSNTLAETLPYPADLAPVAITGSILQTQHASPQTKAVARPSDDRGRACTTQRVSNEGASRTPRDITGLREGGNSAESKMSQSGRGSDRLVSRLAQPMWRAWCCFTTCRRESIVREPRCLSFAVAGRSKTWPERGRHDEYPEEEARSTYMCYQAAA